MKIFIFVAFTAFSAVLAHGAWAAESGIVSHIQVVSDKVEDVSSMEAWKKSFIKEGMTDEQKALAIWTTVVKFRHQDPPPIEFLTGDGGDVHDPIKTFNVYGYGMCCCASSNISALARYVGLKTRAWGINGHSVPEIYFNGAWHLYDASLICYFKKSDGAVAGVEEIISNIGAWYDTHPDYRKNNDKLYKFMGNGGWKKGPEILAHTEAYDNNGWLPAATHGWYSTMQEYDGRGGGKDNKAFLYEYGYSQGYEVNIQLRSGERLVRNWSNLGEHINSDKSGGEPGALKEKVGADQLRYAPGFGDIAPGRVGNGMHDYSVPLANGKYRGGALIAENLEDTPAGIQVKDAARPAVLVIRMRSPYVIINAGLAVASTLGDGGEITVEVSDNNRLDWKSVQKITQPSENIALKAFVHRRYDYSLRFTLKGKGTGLKSVAISDSIQHSQRALPALDKGDNKINFSTGPDEGTVTLEARDTLADKDKQLTFLDFHPIVENIEEGNLRLKAGAGSIAFPVKTPGSMTRLRFGSFYRARDASDGWDYQVSFDGGKTYKTVDHAPGLTGNGQSKYVVFNDIPPATTEALVRFSGKQRNTTMISNFRIDADYTEPHGAFQPVKMTYTWEENGQQKKDVHTAKSPAESYTIHCDAKPLMKSLVLEWAE